VDDSDDSGAADPRMVFDTEGGQALADDLRRPVLLETEFRMTVQVTPQRGVFVVPAANMQDGVGVGVGHGLVARSAIAPGGNGSAAIRRPHYARLARLCRGSGGSLGSRCAANPCRDRKGVIIDDAGFAANASTRISAGRARVLPVSRKGKCRRRPRH
jgi:hypothetical protein